MANSLSFKIISLLIIGLVASLGSVVILNMNENPTSNTDNFITQNPLPYKIITFNNSEFTYSQFESNIKYPGVDRDGIPPIEHPKYITGTDASTYLTHSKIVFGLIYGDNVIAYPRYILMLHEIVNDYLNGNNVSITYCPLTGTAIGYVGHIALAISTFGVSGTLLNDNLVMYDRNSSSFWPQIMGEAINGTQMGYKLERFQLFWTTWGQWYALHPETKVLSEDTGYHLPYNEDFLGSYYSNDSYYHADGVFLPTMTNNSILRNKTVVYATSLGNNHLAIEKSLLKEKKVLNIYMYNQHIAVFYDEGLDTARIYKGSLNGINYEFKYVNGSFIDVNTDTTWSIEGVSTSGSLEPIVYFDSMWFGWYNFHPDTSLIIAKN